MSQIIVSEKQDLTQLMREVFREEAKAIIPELVRQATAKPWLTKEEIMDLTGWSSRTLQNLRDTNQIPYSKHGRKILYPRSGIMEFLEQHQLEPRTK